MMLHCQRQKKKNAVGNIRTHIRGKSTRFILYITIYIFSLILQVYRINTGETLYSTVSDDLIFDNSFSDIELKSKMKENFKDMPLSAKIDLVRHLRLVFFVI